MFEWSNAKIKENYKITEIKVAKEESKDNNCKFINFIFEK